MGQFYPDMWFFWTRLQAEGGTKKFGNHWPKVMIFLCSPNNKRQAFSVWTIHEGYFDIKRITFWDFWQTFFNFFQLFTFFTKTKQSKNRNISEWNHETFHGHLTPDDASDAPSRHRHRQNITIVDVLHRLGYCVVYAYIHTLDRNPWYSTKKHIWPGLRFLPIHHLWSNWFQKNLNRKV